MPEALRRQAGLRTHLPAHLPPLRPGPRGVQVQEAVQQGQEDLSLQSQVSSSQVACPELGTFRIF